MALIDPSVGILVAASAIVFGPLAGWVAQARGRQPLAWLAFGALIGPIALIIVWLGPPGRCPTCDEPVEGWDTGPCPRCGTSYRRREERPVPRATANADEPVVATAPARVRMEPDPVTLRDPATSVARATRGKRPSAMTSTSGKTATEPVDTSPGRRTRTRRPVAADDAASASSNPRPSRSAAAHRPRNGHAGLDDVARLAPIEPPLATPPPTAAPAPRAPATEMTPSAVTMITVAAYVGGSEQLEIGTRYAIARHGDAVRILGPVDIAPARVAVEHGLADLEAVTVGDRLLLSDVTYSPPRFVLAFRVPPGTDDVSLEDAFRVRAGGVDASANGR